MNDEDPTTALTEAQVARRLGISSAVLRAWRSRGAGPRFCRFGRSVRYLQADIDHFIAANIVGSMPANKVGPDR
jgi:predicted DNA-binding transcriptional regulator AlpA